MCYCEIKYNVIYLCIIYKNIGFYQYITLKSTPGALQLQLMNGIRYCKTFRYSTFFKIDKTTMSIYIDTILDLKINLIIEQIVLRSFV